MLIRYVQAQVCLIIVTQLNYIQTQIDIPFLTNLAQLGANFGNLANTVNNLNQAFQPQGNNQLIPQSFFGNQPAANNGGLQQIFGGQPAAGVPLRPKSTAQLFGGQQPIRPIVNSQNNFIPRQASGRILPVAPQPFPDGRPDSPLGQLQFPTQLDQLVRQENFGLKKGEGCIPLLGNVVRVLFADCQQKADNRQIQSWGGHLNGALSHGKLDVLGAAKETCKLQAERNNCQKLVDMVATCDILGSFAIATEFEQAKQRCDKLTLLALQPPKQQNQVVNKLTDFIGSEVAHSLLQNFLG